MAQGGTNHIHELLSPETRKKKYKGWSCSIDNELEIDFVDPRNVHSLG